MAIHRNLTGAAAVHPFALISATDAGAIGAGKAVIDTSTSPHTLRYRNADNTGLEELQVGGNATPAALAALTTRVETLETDGAPPETHASTHADGGGDELTLATSQITGLDAVLGGLDTRVEALEAAAAPAFAALTDGATITWATAGAVVNNAKVTLAGNRSLDITGAVNGASGELRVTQDGTGGRTLTLPVGSKVVNGPLALGSGAGALSILAWSYDGTTFVFTYGEAV